MKFSVIATPIGNLEDITLRALRVLKEADIILCEDTRVTKKLLSHYDIHTKTLSFHAHSTARDMERVVELLQQGKHVAMVTDAGTPGISDPGLSLVSYIRQTLEEPHIEVIPGPSALSAALSISGLHTQPVTFYGFLPLKKGRETLLREIAASSTASVFYESPHRIMKTLSVLMERMPERRVGMFRELTKMYEESVIGFPKEIYALLESDVKKQQGEFVIIVEGQ